MFASAILMATAMTSASPAGPQNQTARPPQQYKTLADLFDADARTWTQFPMTISTLEEPEEAIAGESLYDPIVRETLEAPPARQLSGFMFGVTR